MKKNLAVIVILFVTASLFTWLLFVHPVSTQPPTLSSKLSVIASFYPVAEFARAVGGELVAVVTITPAGVEPHDYEPLPQQISAIYKSDIFLYNGGGVDAWATRIAPDVASRNVVVSELSKTIDVVKPAEGSEDPNAAFDPHYWLDPVLAKKEVMNIQQTFAQKDSDHADQYKKNADAYIAKLSALDQSYKNGLATCRNKTVVTSHAAFAYLAKQYGFAVIPISGLSPDEEPSAGRLAEIAKLAKQKNIKYIFFETLASPKLSETISNEIGAQTLEFNPLEGLSSEDQASGKNYLTVMTQNLTNLKTAMMCQ